MKIDFNSDIHNGKAPNVYVKNIMFHNNIIRKYNNYVESDIGTTYPHRSLWQQKLYTQNVYLSELEYRINKKKCFLDMELNMEHMQQ